MPKATDEQNARYLAGVCVTCGTNGHAPGRPRCDQCAEAGAVAFIEPELTRKGRGR